MTPCQCSHLNYFSTIADPYTDVTYNRHSNGINSYSMAAHVDYGCDNNYKQRDELKKKNYRVMIKSPSWPHMQDEPK